MPLDLLKRSENAGSLTQTQHDTNFTAIEAAVNASSSINGHIETVAVKTYVLELKAPTAYTISSLTHGRLSGSCTVSVQINGTNVTGLTGVVVNTARTSPTETTATAANVVAVGNRVELVVTANTACLDFGFTVKVTP